MAAKSFDYSKWDNIELSDDESDLHPNIDKVIPRVYHFRLLSSVWSGFMVPHEASLSP